VNRELMRPGNASSIKRLEPQSLTTFVVTAVVTNVCLLECKRDVPTVLTIAARPSKPLRILVTPAAGQTRAWLAAKTPRLRTTEVVRRMDGRADRCRLTHCGLCEVDSLSY
jgi:hypothetical protein